MKLKCSFEFVDMGDEIIAVPIGEKAKDVHGIIKLNKEGEEILKMLEENTSEKSMIDALAAKYETDAEVISEYVHLVVNSLRNNELLEE